MEHKSLFPFRIWTLLQSSTKMFWFEGYKDALRKEDPLYKRKSHNLDNLIMNTAPPLEWDADGKLQWNNIENALRCIYWMKDTVPEFAYSELEAYGFDLDDMENPQHPEFTPGNDNVVYIRPKKYKFTIPIGTTIEEHMFR